MKRLFIGIDISADARRRAASYVEELRRTAGDLRVGWERPEKLHITLKFLGDVPETRLGLMEAALGMAAAEIGSYIASLSGTGYFPPRGFPRVLWLGVDDQGETARVSSSLENELAGRGYPREIREFSPHLTIGRLREPERSRKLAEIHLQKKFEPISFKVSELVLYESSLQPSGSIHTRLQTFPLKD